jgi:ferritin-like protein
MSSESLHESPDLITEKTKNLHRAIVTLIEELEAVDWYQQRADACTDDELRAVIDHNRREEIEHAMMTLEWLRRNHSDFAEHIDTYLLTSVPITEVEESKKRGRATLADAADSVQPATLGIGSLRGVK